MDTNNNEPTIFSSDVIAANKSNELKELVIAHKLPVINNIKLNLEPNTNNS